MPAQKTVRTPCIGICSTTYGDTVCRGCSRFYHEVVQWNSLNEAQKRLVCARIDEINALILSKYLTIDDLAFFKQQLQAYAIRIDPARSPWTWVNTLLGVLEKKDLKLEVFGINQLQLPIEELALVKKVQQEILSLSSGFYDIQTQAFRHESLQNEG